MYSFFRIAYYLTPNGLPIVGLIDQFERITLVYNCDMQLLAYYCQA